jgi:YidC/Oxa1 family membrane protein insertase
MDKQTIFGFVIIALLFMAWMYFTLPDSNQQQQQQAQVQQKPDSAKAAADSSATQAAPVQPQTPAPADTLSAATMDIKTRTYGKWFSNAAEGEEHIITVETDLYTAEFSTVSGGIRRWTLKNFTKWDKEPLQLIDWNIPCDPNLLLTTTDGRVIDTRSNKVFFRFAQYPEGGKVVLKDSATYTVEMVLPVDQQENAAIVKRFVLKNGSYHADFDIEMRNMQNVIANNEYWITMSSGNLTEQNSVDEATFAEANASVDQDRISIDATSKTESYKESRHGTVHWVSTHNKYFLNALIAKDGSEGLNVTLEGRRIDLPDNGEREVYTVLMMRPYDRQPLEKSSFSVYIGPIQYDILKAEHEGLEQVMNLGWAWIVRPFSEYLIIPLFTLLHKVIPNYGIVIIIFTLIIKILLYPLTKSSTKSMRKMQALQPMMTEVREKYKDDPQRQNVEIMKLYKDYGINPAGGCLPLMLQMPILFALFAIFRSTIELRQQPFFWWIHDLSSPDVIFHLPFSIPLFGITNISGLALAMAITMFFQQKQTVTDPRQKSMIYVMPIMFWIMFNGFPSGLNLYYFVFNVLSIAQQYYINKRGKDMKLEKVKPKKRTSRMGWADQAVKALQQQQKTNKR